MLVKDDLERLLDYNIWANHRLMRAAATLSVDDFKRDTLRASHGGVRGTLAHILSAEWIWLERWKGLSPTRHLDEGEFPDVVALRDRWTLIEGHRGGLVPRPERPDAGRPRGLPHTCRRRASRLRSGSSCSTC